jgi:hypothetical protein
LAESHLTRRLFGSMLRRIWALPVPTGQSWEVKSEMSANISYRLTLVRRDGDFHRHLVW